MGVFGKLMDSMRINDIDEDEYYDEDEYDEAPRRSIFKRQKSDDDYYDDDEEIEQPKSSLFSHKSNNVTPVRRGMEVTMVKPSAVEDARAICNFLLGGKAVVLNMEGLPTELAQRIIDFTSGATYSMDGKLQKISNFIFIATPQNVDLSGDFQDLLNSSQFDLNGSGVRY